MKSSHTDSWIFVGDNDLIDSVSDNDRRDIVVLSTVGGATYLAYPADSSLKVKRYSAGNDAWTPISDIDKSVSRFDMWGFSGVSPIVALSDTANQTVTVYVHDWGADTWTQLGQSEIPESDVVRVSGTQVLYFQYSGLTFFREVLFLTSLGWADYLTLNFAEGYRPRVYTLLHSKIEPPFSDHPESCCEWRLASGTNVDDGVGLGITPPPHDLLSRTFTGGGIASSRDIGFNHAFAGWDSGGGLSLAHVKLKESPPQGSWERSASQSFGSTLDIVVSGNVVVYSDIALGGKIVAKRYNVDANVDADPWELMGVEGFSDGLATDIALWVSDPGASGIYSVLVAFSDESRSGKSTVMKWNGSQWVTIGSAGFSPGPARKHSITFDSINQIAYVAFHDTTTNKVRVMKHPN